MGQKPNMVLEMELDSTILNGLSDKGILWKYSIQKMKTTDSALLSLLMRDNGRCDIPHAAQPRVERYSTVNINWINQLSEWLKTYTILKIEY